MTVGQVIDLAKVSELNGLGIANNDAAVIGFLNLGMLELYKRFTLKYEEHLITLDENVSIYTMPADYMWIIAAYGDLDARSGDFVNLIPINEEDNPASINTSSWNKIQIPVNTGGAHISIIYVAKPTVYTIDDMDVELDLPPQMIEALLAYIGYRGNSTIDSGLQTEDNAWFIRFDSSCNKIKQESMLNSDDMYMKDRLGNRGFV